ncbi:MAG: hypothetical protein J0I12_17325 [Candidatus Eremiobacteraeota bacterium]|nr:hypothetical protein [Candidatus Eremiobacteraeota bacterium]
MARRLAELALLLGLCALAVRWRSAQIVPELDWSLGRGTLRVEQAYSAMGESGGDRMELVYSSADKRTLFLGGSEVLEVASFDHLVLPDGMRIRAGESVSRLAAIWPLRYRPTKDGLAPFSLTVSRGGKWYEGPGNLWVYASREGRLEYFDLSREAATALGGPMVESPPKPPPAGAEKAP